MGKSNAWRRTTGWSLLALAALASTPAAAQVQRNFTNLSFEQPNLVTAGCRVYIAASQVPGWNTTHRNQATENSGGCVVPPGFAQTAPILEIWRTPRNNNSGGTVNAPTGSQIAELNAADASRIYQNVCLINGERVDWRFSHRGRSSATVRDRMEMKVGATATVVRIGTTNTGAIDTPVVLMGSINTPVQMPGNTSWVNYSGSFTYGGATGGTNMGFESMGGTTEGNLLDDIQIQLAPFVEFTRTSSSTPESASANLPTLRINGTVTAAFTVVVRIVGGTATIGSDYLTPGNSTTISVNIPAGVYDGVGAGSLFALPVQVVNDAVPEDNETIEFLIEAPVGASPPYLLASSATCGGAVQTQWTYTIVDDDAEVALTKNVGAAVAVAGQPGVFDVGYTIMVQNPSATVVADYALVDVPGFDPDASIISASYSRNGGAAVALPGAGPWTLQPPWRQLAANATDTYVFTVRLALAQGGRVDNDACTGAPGNGLFNAVQATVRGQGGDPDVEFGADGCVATPTPAWVRLGKRLEGRAVASDQAQVRLYAGGILAASATTSGSGLPAAATTSGQVLSPGTTVQFNESIKTNGTGADRTPSAYAVGLSCSNASAGSPTPLPGGPGAPTASSQEWPEFSVAAGDDIDCVIVNTLNSADVGVAKSVTPTEARTGDQVTYTLVVGNAGPSAA
ncbi:MAG TPA: hypothetical protein PLD19_09360, partial [Luteimonas sp.]|nr:hypothetical protein [Luteimonas sp.]